MFSLPLCNGAWQAPVSVAYCPQHEFVFCQRDIQGGNTAPSVTHLPALRVLHHDAAASLMTVINVTSYSNEQN